MSTFATWTQVRANYDEFALPRVASAAVNFATNDLSSIYFDLIKVPHHYTMIT